MKSAKNICVLMQPPYLSYCSILRTLFSKRVIFFILYASLLSAFLSHKHDTRICSHMKSYLPTSVSCFLVLIEALIVSNWYDSYIHSFSGLDYLFYAPYYVKGQISFIYLQQRDQKSPGAINQVENFPYVLCNGYINC